MTNAFIETLRPILILCKFLGIINTSYYLESNGLLIRSTNSTYYSFLEFIKTLVLIILTYNIHRQLIFIEVLCLYKFWIVIITSRISENWIIKLINDMIEYDRKLTSLPRYLKAHQRSFSKQHWNIMLVCASLYYIVMTLLILYTWPIKTMSISVFSIYFVRVSFLVDFIVIVSSYFYLRNLEYRFETLNDFWKCLPTGLLAVPGTEFSSHDIAVMVDTIRLLHAELSEILRIFSLGYGQMLLGYFVFSYIDMLVRFFYIVCFKLTTPEDKLTVHILKEALPHILNVQSVIFTMSVLMTASRVNEKKRQIISYLRLTRISNLSIALKIQIIILLISGLATLIQMKEHPAVLQTVNSAKNFIQHVSYYGEVNDTKKNSHGT